MQLLDPIVHYAWKKIFAWTSNSLSPYFPWDNATDCGYWESSARTKWREEYQFFQCYRFKNLATSFHLVFWSQQSDCGWIVRKNSIWKRYTWSTNLSSRNTINALRLVVKKACIFSRTLGYDQGEFSVLTDWLMEVQLKQLCVALFESHWPRKALKQSCT